MALAGGGGWAARTRNGVASSTPALGVVTTGGAGLLLFGKGIEGFPSNLTVAFFLGMGLLGLSSALLLAPATTLISEQGFRSDPPTLGGSFALYNLAYAAGLAFGPLLTGFWVQQAGFTTAMVIAAVVLAVLGGASLFRLPARRDAAAQEQRERHAE